nr:Odorant receptor 33C like [Ipomoea batatas]
MGISTREKGLLKLVHPGGHVEVYREPVAAAEVMKKYPRHCITRPDVFKFPWVVVKPEAVLLPGKVFYVVPYLTVYQLLKDRRQKNQHTPRHEHSENNAEEQPVLSSDNYFPSYKLIDGESHHRLDPSLPHRKNQPSNNQENSQSSSLSLLSKKEHPLKHHENHHSSSQSKKEHHPKHQENHHSSSQGSSHLEISHQKIGESHSFASQETPIRSSAGRTPKHINRRMQNSPLYRPRNEEELSQSPNRPVYYAPSTELASSSKKMNRYQNALLDDRSSDRSYSYSGRRQYTDTKNISRPKISSRGHEADDHHTRGSTSTQVKLKSSLKVRSRGHEADDHHTRGSTSTQVRQKSSLRKPGSAQRKRNLRVTFASSVFIPTQERDSPAQQHNFTES